MRPITFEDRGRHHPAPGAKPNWQESFYLGWVDVERRMAGAHHISLAPKGDTHVWSWVMLDGKVVARSQQHGIALPEGDLENLKVGSLHVVAGKTLRDLTLRAEFDGGTADLVFRGVCDPVEMNLNQDDTILADFHYEAMGMVSGALTLDGVTTPIRATGWHDHSWGAREFSSNPSHRWLFSVFGEDLAMSCFSFVTGQRRAQFGWVFDNGAVYPVRRAAFHVVVNDDGVTPEGCTASLYTEGNRGYQVTGTCHASALMGGHGWFGVDGVTEFQCGGRLGQGYLEIAELKTLTPQMKAELGLQ